MVLSKKTQRPSDQETDANGSGSACYHCDQKSISNRFCDTWKVWSCVRCIDRHHKAHHNACDLVIPRSVRENNAMPQGFMLWLTRYDGRRCSMLCRLGEKLQMEDHWMGTYVFASGGMILVQENRETINARIIEGLSTTK